MLKLLNSTLFLYIFTVIVWGSTWFTIEYQLGVVPHEYSSFYRFALASLMLFVYCFYKKLNLKFSLKDHFWMALLGLTLFCLNYLMVYEAQVYLTSAMASVIFSSILIVNIFNSWMFFKTPISKEVILGAVIGLAGILCIFWKDLGDLSFENKMLYGLAISLLGVLAASIGNMVSVQTQKYQLPVIQMNAYAMGYGSLLSLLIGLVQSKPIIYDTAPTYSISMVYLSLFGSVLAFGAYLTLLRRIGIHKATYIVVLFPAVALIISTFFEDFQWTWPIAIGIVLIGIGNLFVVNKKDLSSE